MVFNLGLLPKFGYSSFMNHVLLLAGGSGTRFWPKSRKRLPKQFLSIIGEEPLIVSTINRMQSLIHNDNI